MIEYFKNLEKAEKGFVCLVFGAVNLVLPWFFGFWFIHHFCSPCWSGFPVVILCFVWLGLLGIWPMAKAISYFDKHSY